MEIIEVHIKVWGNNVFIENYRAILFIKPRVYNLFYVYPHNIYLHDYFINNCKITTQKLLFNFVLL